MKIGAKTDPSVCPVGITEVGHYTAPDSCRCGGTVPPLRVTSRLVRGSGYHLSNSRWELRLDGVHIGTAHQAYRDGVGSAGFWMWAGGIAGLIPPRNTATEPGGKDLYPTGIATRNAMLAYARKCIAARKAEIRALRELRSCDGPGDQAWTQLNKADARAAVRLEVFGLVESGYGRIGRVEWRLTQRGRETKW